MMNTEEEPDTPETIYECPVCKKGVALVDVHNHLNHHREMGQIKPKDEDLLHGLEYVADQVVLRLTEDEAIFIADQNILESELFDARGMTGKELYRPMKDLGLNFCVGNPCQRASHRLRTRNNHCIQCDKAKIAFQQRWNKPGRVYVAYAPDTKLVKVGTAECIYLRIDSLNSYKYGGSSQWQIQHWKDSPRAGYIEHLAQRQLQKFNAAGEYFKDGEWRDCRELFKCTVNQAIDALDNALEKE